MDPVIRLLMTLATLAGTLYVLELVGAYAAGI